MIALVLPRSIAQVGIEAVTVDVHLCILNVHVTKTIGECSEVVCKQSRGLPILLVQVPHRLVIVKSVDYVRNKYFTTSG